MCTDCDINYKQSQSKRLLVEITLIEIAQLTQEDTPSSGRSPKKTLKPIFSQQAEAAQPNNKIAAPTKNQGAQPTGSASTPASAPNINAANLSAPKPQQGLKAKGFSISGLMDRSKQQTSQQDNPGQQQVTAQTVQPSASTAEADRPLDSTALLTAWRDFAHNLPQEETAMANRLKDTDPAIIDANTIEVLANNELVEKEIKAFVPRLLPFLQNSLHNRSIQISVRTRKQEEKQRAYNRVEQFNMMCQINDALLKLKEEFDLEVG